MQHDASQSKEQRFCKNCTWAFSPKRPWQKFCKPECRKEYWDKDHPRVTRKEIEKYLTGPVILSAEDEAALEKMKPELFHKIKTILSQQKPQENETT